ncbi:MAG: tetratricopeptide repeat protein [bacterium]
MTAERGGSPGGAAGDPARGGSSSDSRLARIEAIFHECAALPEAERVVRLAALCGEDVALRGEILELLVHDARPASGILTPIVPHPAGDTGAAGDDSPRAHTVAAGDGARGALPDTIGPYRFVEKLGEGGFGEVFAAEQSEPVRRRVAIKILKPGMDSRAVLARFEAERHALALMDHPSVAKVLDAGATNEGRPYFVMELVSGESITEFCDRAAPSLRERLELFIAVCRAVEHAHQKGVIHRDLKPSNILVTTADGKPLPKVIDFGIAKATAAALAGETLHTRAGEFLGTPEFMSPEHAQSGGADVDTRADVYSLGAILYRLLTGRLPFASETLRGAGIAQIQKVLREEEPPRPSAAARAGERAPTAIARELAGDLDWIIGRAMEKDRARRYSSPAAFADDIERHLRDEPVLAGPPSTLYRVGKLARRHRALVAGAAAVVAALLVGIAATTMQAARARRSEQEARSQAQIATAVNAFLTAMLREANPEFNPRSAEVTVREMVDRAARLVDADAVASPRVSAAIHHALATTYIGLALFDEAEPHLRRAVETRRAETGERSDETLESRLALAELELRRRRYAAAESAFAAIGAEIEARHGAPAELKAQYQRLRGETLTNLGRHAEAESLLAVAVAVQRAAGPHGAELAALQAERARLLVDIGRLDDAEAAAREAVALQRRLHEGDDAHVASALGVLAIAVAAKGDLAEEERLEREVLEMQRRILGPSHLSIAVALGNLGDTMQKAGRLAEAESLQREGLALLIPVLGDDNAEVAVAKDLLAISLQDQGKHEEALAVRREVLDTLRRLFGPKHLDSARALNNLGALYRRMGRHDDAVRAFEEARAVTRELLGDEHPLVVIATNNIGKSLLDQGRAAEAETTFSSALAVADRAFPEGHPNRAVLRSNYGRALAAIGRRDEAESELLSAHAALSASLGAQHPRTRDVAQTLADLYAAWRRPDDAARWRRAAEPGA